MLWSLTADGGGEKDRRRSLRWVVGEAVENSHLQFPRGVPVPEGAPAPAPSSAVAVSSRARVASSGATPALPALAQPRKPNERRTAQRGFAHFLCRTQVGKKYRFSVCGC